MENKDTKGFFLWGTPEQVRANDRTDVPTLRLCNPDGTLAPVVLPFTMKGTKHITSFSDRGRVVGNVFENDDAVYCFMAGVLPGDLSVPGGEQTTSVFKSMERFLGENGFTFHHVVRTWLYIDKVCDWYGEFNAARSKFFEERNVFNIFLPASTGIGTANLDGAALTSACIAMKPKREGVRVEEVASPLQAPAMAYKSSFSRAAEIIRGENKLLFISGTASIKPDSHDVAYVGDIEKQIDCTMNAMRAILESRNYSWADVTRGIVYLKEPGFLAPWREWLKRNNLPADFVAETVADVCRDEWLVEIEVDAQTGLV